MKMNDEPLPPIHGFPARLIVPGLYGYVSATKWLSELEVTTWRRSTATGSRSAGPRRPDPDPVPDRHAEDRRDRVRAGSRSPASRGRPIAAIPKVEVAIDDVWQEARLSTPISDATWVQWVVDWDVDARATTRSWSGPPTATGETQTDQRDAAGARTAPAAGTRSHVRGA